jgi:hypothetical protein
VVGAIVVVVVGAIVVVVVVVGATVVVVVVGATVVVVVVGAAVVVVVEGTQLLPCEIVEPVPVIPFAPSVAHTVNEVLTAILPDVCIV